MKKSIILEILESIGDVTSSISLVPNPDASEKTLVVQSLNDANESYDVLSFSEKREMAGGFDSKASRSVVMSDALPSDASSDSSRENVTKDFNYTLYFSFFSLHRGKVVQHLLGIQTSQRIRYDI